MVADGRWEPNAAASHDPSVREADNFGLLTRSTYKVLLTRGLQGCIIHSVDQTRNMLAGLGQGQRQRLTGRQVRLVLAA
jgi:hypothetical protein